jgi:hypothetical protein
VTDDRFERRFQETSHMRVMKRVSRKPCRFLSLVTCCAELETLGRDKRFSEA